MTETRDHNAIFAEQMAQRERERSEKLLRAKAEAVGTGKEPFSDHRFKKLYKKLCPDDVDRHTPWQTLLRESEYDYYVKHPGMKTLAEFIEHEKWMDGYG